MTGALPSHLRPSNNRTASNASTASGSFGTSGRDVSLLLQGHVGHLSEAQVQSLNAFKALLFAQGLYVTEPKPSHDDATLLRFLRARKWDAQAALKQFKEAEEWRKSCGVDMFFAQHDIASYNQARKVYPCWTGRRTKRGLPFYVYRVQELDKKTLEAALAGSLKQSQLHMKKVPHPHGHGVGDKQIMPIVALYEALLQLVMPLLSSIKDRPNPETPVSASVNIVDITGVGLKQFFNLRGHLAEASALATARYPETLDSILVIGAPSYTETIFEFIGRWFDPVTRAKIKIMPATDKAATLARLEQVIDIDNIPKVYGGNLDWHFGDMPNIDPAIREAYGYEPQQWPAGPVYVQGDEIVAVGSNADGTLRHDIVGKLRDPQHSSETKPYSPEGVAAANVSAAPIHPASVPAVV